MLADKIYQSGLCDNDVYILIGYAQELRDKQGETDNQNYLWELAERIARSVGNKSLELRVQEMAHTQAV